MMVLFSVAPKNWVIERANLYLALETNYRARYLYWGEHLLRETSPIDLLFLGHSAVEAGFDPNMITRRMKKEMGREPVIRTIGHALWPKVVGRGIDYILLHDLLEKRTIKHMFFQLNRGSSREELDTNALFLFDSYLHWDAIKRMDKKQAANILYFNFVKSLWTLYVGNRDARGYPHKHKTERNWPDLYYSYDYLVENNGFHPFVSSKKEIKHLVRKKIRFPRLSVAELTHKGPDLNLAKPYKPLEKALIDSIVSLSEKNGVDMHLYQLPYYLDKSIKTGVRVPEVDANDAFYNKPVYGLPIRAKKIMRKHKHHLYSRPPSTFHLNRTGATYNTLLFFPIIRQVLLSNEEAK